MATIEMEYPDELAQELAEMSAARLVERGVDLTGLTPRQVVVRFIGEYIKGQFITWEQQAIEAHYTELQAQKQVDLEVARLRAAEVGQAAVDAAVAAVEG